MAAVDPGALPALLAEVVSPAELDAVTGGFARSVHAGQLRIDDRLVPGGPPQIALTPDAPLDARELCSAWGMRRPVAVSPDVHQSTWAVLVAGDELPDPHGRRIASAPFTAGRWQIVPYLAQRPAGGLPGVASGASPAYDIRERGGLVTSIEVRPVTHTVATGSDPEPLLTAMQATYPVWRGGWRIDPQATFVTVDDGAGAALTCADDGIAYAAQICLVRKDLGPALLDALEAVARTSGSARLRLDSSAFLHSLPHDRYGYVVGPPYDGDADVEVWAEKDLVMPPASAP